MDKKTLEQLSQTSTDILFKFNTISEDYSEDVSTWDDTRMNYFLDNVEEGYSFYEDFLTLLENNNLTEEETKSLPHSKQTGCTNIEEIKKQIHSKLDTWLFAIGTRMKTLLQASKNNEKLFNIVLKENPWLTDKERFTPDYLLEFDELLNNPVFKNYYNQFSQVKSFEKGTIKLANVDDEVLVNDYLMNRITNSVKDKLYNAFKDPLQNANSIKQKNKIKNMLDEKISNTVLNLVSRQERFLEQKESTIKKEIEKYEV